MKLPVRAIIDRFVAAGANLCRRWCRPARRTLVADASVERIDDFFAIEKQLMANDSLRKSIANYHDLVIAGRREIYRVEQ
jgi:hypothetical protein